MSNLCNYLLIRVNLEPIKSNYHKLSPTICDYEQLISIGYKYNQFENDDVS